MGVRFAAICGTVVAIGLGAAVFGLLAAKSPDLPVANPVGPGGGQVEPMVSWREPAKDLPAFFPSATEQREEAWILSSGRKDLQDMLGRHPEPDEYVLHLHRALQGEKPVGSVVVRRVKGTSGALELVIALTPEDKVKALRFQRSREPEPVMKALTDAQWLGSFNGRGPDGDWTLGKGVPAVSGEAAEPAQGVADAIHSTLVMAQIARRKGLRDESSAHH
jgi:hypothetical protein